MIPKSVLHVEISCGSDDRYSADFYITAMAVCVFCRTVSLCETEYVNVLFPFVIRNVIRDGSLI